MPDFTGTHGGAGAVAEAQESQGGQANLSPSSAQPLVSVVIPCFNSRATLTECLRSIAEQSYPRDRVEVLLCDNGSTDEGPEMAQQMFRGVTLLRTTQKGSGHARNAGFFAARGELIVSTDADCVADPGWVAALVRAMTNASANTAAVGGAILPFSLRTMVERYDRAWVSQPGDQALDHARYVATPNGCFRPEAFRHVGGFDGDAGHDDSDLGLRLVAAGYRIGYTGEAIVRHRNPVTFRELYEHRRKYGERNFTLAQKHMAALGDPRGVAKRRKLLRETVRRVTTDLIKMPLSLVYRPKRRAIGWPAVDLVMAVGNYRGFAQASAAFDRSQHGRSAHPVS